MRVFTVLLHIPGRKVLQQLLPVALGGTTLWIGQGCCAVKADQQRTNVFQDNQMALQPSVGQSPQSSAALPSMLSGLLGTNEFANGGLTLMLVGAAAAGARAVLGTALRYCKRHIMVQAEVDSRDDAYRWLMFWLSQHPKFRKSTTVSVTTNLAGTFGTSLPALPLSAATAGPQVTFLPAPGDHLLRYRGHWMMISRQRTTGNPQLAANARLLLETMRISMLGTNRGPLEALLAEAASSYTMSQACRTVVHSVTQDGYWDQVGSRPIRPLNTVVLPQGQAEGLLADCQEFLSSESWYAHHGIPFRRGYLLYGPPGTGKTSLVMALAGALGLEIYVVTLSSPTMSDETLRHLLNTAGTRSVLLLEDVDAAFVDRAAGQDSARLTFSGLLNSIDGVAAQEGRLLFMTTNHIERLNSALIRPGRVDVRCYLGPATREQARQMFMSFYRDLPMQLELQGAQQAASGRQPAAAHHQHKAPVQQQQQQQRQQQRQRVLHRQEQLQELHEPMTQQGQTPNIMQDTQTGPVTHATQALPARTSVGQTLSRVSSVQQPAERESVLIDLANDFAKKLPEQPGFSTAQLQAFLMTYRLQPERAVQEVEQWLHGIQATASHEV